MVPLLHYQGESQDGVTRLQEDKGALAKLMEALWTSYNNRYNEICYHWGGNILGPKSMAHIA